MPDFKCEDCACSQETFVTLECQHAAAGYKPVTKFGALDAKATVVFHSADHMRTRGACGPEGKLFKRRPR